MTDLEIYDRSVFEYLSAVIDTEYIVYAPTDNAIRTITQREQFKDKTPLRFISFYRNPTFDIDMSRYNSAAAIRGDIVQRRIDENGKFQGVAVANIPVNLTYQVDLWASKNTLVQELAIDLITRLYMQSQVLTAPMNPDSEEPARFHFVDITWEDNSDIESEIDRGKLYRHTISFTIDSRIKLVKPITTEKFCCCGDLPLDIYE